MKRIVISIIAVALCAGIAGAKEPAGTLTRFRGEDFSKVMNYTCLLYTSDAADEL